MNKKTINTITTIFLAVSASVLFVLPALILDPNDQADWMIRLYLIFYYVILLGILGIAMIWVAFKTYKDREKLREMNLKFTIPVVVGLIMVGLTLFVTFVNGMAFIARSTFCVNEKDSCVEVSIHTVESTNNSGRSGRFFSQTIKFTDISEEKYLLFESTRPKVGTEYEVVMLGDEKYILDILEIR